MVFTVGMNAYKMLTSIWYLLFGDNTLIYGRDYRKLHLSDMIGEACEDKKLGF